MLETLLIAKRFEADPAARRARVTITTIDAFCSANNIDQISVLKTDTEGFDAEVLRGADKML